MSLPKSFINEARKLDNSQIFYLLGEILEPSIYSPFDLPDEVMDELFPITKMYQDYYESVIKILERD